MEVRADRAAHAAALPTALAVVPEPGHHPAQCLRAGIEPRPAGVVLEARERSPHAGLELALEQDVPDHPPVPRDRVEGEDAHTWELRSAEVAIRPAEQLVPAAHGQQGGAVRERLVDALALVREVGGDERLLAVLAAADVEQVVLPGSQRLAHRHGTHLQLVAAPRRTPLQHRDVAAVGVDVEVVRVEMADDDLHAASSQ